MYICITIEIHLQNLLNINRKNWMLSKNYIDTKVSLPNKKNIYSYLKVAFTLTYILIVHILVYILIYTFNIRTVQFAY